MNHNIQSLHALAALWVLLLHAIPFYGIGWRWPGCSQAVVRGRLRGRGFVLGYQWFHYRQSLSQVSDYFDSGFGYMNAHFGHPDCSEGVLQTFKLTHRG